MGVRGDMYAVKWDGVRGGVNDEIGTNYEVEEEDVTRDEPSTGLPLPGMASCSPTNTEL